MGILNNPPAMVFSCDVPYLRSHVAHSRNELFRALSSVLSCVLLACLESTVTNHVIKASFFHMQSIFVANILK